MVVRDVAFAINLQPEESGLRPAEWTEEISEGRARNPYFGRLPSLRDNNVSLAIFGH
jgi:hypothetical protein